MIMVKLKKEDTEVKGQIIGAMMKNIPAAKPKEKICIGIVAHVDSGKTTLSEAILYLTGAIRKLGRVDHGDAFLDSNAVEQDRGITVFSKEARFNLGEKSVVLLDTPGHADFSTEAERTLQVLDYAILVISGADGVQGDTVTLWNLLKAYKTPVFIFVNKMDQPGADRENIMESLTKNMGSGFVEFKNGEPAGLENAAMCSEILMEEYLETENIKTQSMAQAIEERSMFPVCFGSALKLTGAEDFLKVIEKYARQPRYGEEFGARVYKISRDKQGVRQTHMKITGGNLRSKTLIAGERWQEKAEQIRLFSGKTFESVMEAEAGDICAVTGLNHTYAGEALGIEKIFGETCPIIEPAVNYRIILPENVNPAEAMQKFAQLREEDPSLNIVWKEQLQEIHISVMGNLELEILQRIIKERFDMDVAFSEGGIIYKETIASPVIGIGHFEPLRHYAEVHLLLEPLPRGSGLVFDTMVSEDKMDGNRQRLILNHLRRREHRGVLTGSQITDLKVTLIAGKDHLKHTEGGDFGQAADRALRQGLRKAESLLLEPVYGFNISVPAENVGKAISDIQRAGGQCGLPQPGAGDEAVLEGKAPVAAFRDYQQRLSAYTKGRGKVTLSFAGYERCHNEEDVIRQMGYDPDRDLENPSGSVFCEHGGAVYVDWDKVDERAHVESGFRLTDEGLVEKNMPQLYKPPARIYRAASEKELEEIFLRTYGKSKRDEAMRRERAVRRTGRPDKPEAAGEHRVSSKAKETDLESEQYFIVDGYNVIFAWEELKDLAAVNIDAAREALAEILDNYRSYKNINMIVVFDGYKVSGNAGSIIDSGGMKLVYTKEAETADRFIEKMAFDMGRKKDITVVTSDKAVQMASLGDGAKRMSAREFYIEVTDVSGEIREKLAGQRKSKNRPFEEKLLNNT